ncbi:MAG TPA: ring-cleaving dioxygenase [Gemmatimonadales bacterium]|nr:ring-cleaving dioxygenase [Gemmatimonadales bacterium]
MPHPHVHGLHHVTCIAGDPQENLDFYTKILGMRLVKKSINQDAPDTYHLFYADAAGSPGTDLTFFPWPDAAPGRPGVGLTNEVMLAVPAGSLPWWRSRLEGRKVRLGREVTRFGEKTLPFTDPHGLELALVEIAEDRAFAAWDKSPVPADKQIRGFHAVRLWERDPAPTIRLLVDVMGLAPVGNDDGWQRFGIGGRSGTLIDVKAFPDERRGAWGLGSVHHIAWRVTDTPEEMAVRSNVEGAGLHPTPQIDRFWFQSVYFKEPGGALFELATDGPGFARDEDPAHLGETLVLPPWYEPRRAEIEAGLPALRA